MPPSMTTPITELQRRAEALEYSELLDQVSHVAPMRSACYIAIVRQELHCAEPDLSRPAANIACPRMQPMAVHMNLPNLWSLIFLSHHQARGASASPTAAP